jgi:hypothetical protein
VGPPEVGVLVVAAERGDLEDLAVPANADCPEAVLVDGSRKEVKEPFRAGVRGQVPIGGRSTERGIAQGATDDICRLAGVPQDLEQRVDRVRDRALECRQLRPRKRYVRQASLRSSPR